MAEVTFCTMLSYSELSTESAGNYWIVRFGNDGRITYWRNLRPVEKLPVTTLTKALEYCARELQHKIRAYQIEREEQAKRTAWWNIKEWLANYNTAVKNGLVPVA
jgi:hypothetical protein